MHTALSVQNQPRHSQVAVGSTARRGDLLQSVPGKLPKHSSNSS